MCKTLNNQSAFGGTSEGRVIPAADKSRKKFAGTFNKALVKMISMKRWKIRF